MSSHEIRIHTDGRSIYCWGYKVRVKMKLRIIIEVYFLIN